MGFFFSIFCFYFLNLKWRIWNKIGCKELKDLFKYYPLKKNDVFKMGDNIELRVDNKSEFDNFSDTCHLCKITYPESVEFVNLDCKHFALCRVCRFTETICPFCTQPISNFEAINNVIVAEEA